MFTPAIASFFSLRTLPVSLPVVPASTYGVAVTSHNRHSAALDAAQGARRSMGISPFGTYFRNQARAPASTHGVTTRGDYAWGQLIPVSPQPRSVRGT